MPSASTSPARQHQPGRGAALLALSALFFALMGVCIREATVTGVSNEMVVFFRNAVGVLFFLPLALTRGLAPLRTTRPWAHLKRTFCGLAAMYCYFYALAHLPLTDAMLFSYAAPVFTPLIGWWWLKESLTRRMLLATAIGFAGVVLVAKPSGALVSGISLIGILASIMAACAFVSIREMSNTEPAFRIVFWFALFSALVSALPLLWAWQPLDRQQLFLLLAAGVVASFGQLTMSHAYACAPPGLIGPVAYLAIVFGGIIAWLRWNEVPSSASILGASLIFAASLMPLLRRSPRTAA
ncbi:DMT family transporter [Pseudomonas oryzae]|uniref:Permease of the drug/metabolite transporter (DMT) superfamily n=1 Tax=Pseudomonas oryzae TaxID=1392877 RepID=A0A1H1MPK3_9PSED|nr:DMT family transporter [Pseudomonas oryzae]SDR88688.1 Permease of the drug/metabolite transporter (DMT) superfamily [Pseudomonas oryzae]